MRRPRARKHARTVPSTRHTTVERRSAAACVTALGNHLAGQRSSARGAALAGPRAVARRRSIRRAAGASPTEIESGSTGRARRNRRAETGRAPQKQQQPWAKPTSRSRSRSARQRRLQHASIAWKRSGRGPGRDTASPRRDDSARNRVISAGARTSRAPRCSRAGPRTRTSS